METFCNLLKKVPLLRVSLLLMMALLVCACGNQASLARSISTPEAPTPTASVTHTENSMPLTSIRMVSQSIGWAIAKGSVVLRTTDGGNHWMDVTPHSSYSPQEVMPSFADSLHAWIGYVATMDQGPIIILRTSDGGQSWQRATISANQPTGVVSLQFRGSNYQQGWVMVGIDGGPGAGSEAFGLYATIDGGQSWSALPEIDTSDQMSGLSFLDTTTGFLAFGGAYATPQLSVTHDGGRSWKNLSLPVVPGLPTPAGAYLTTPPVFFGSSGFLPVYLSIDTSAGQMVGGFVIYTTSDGGATWVAKNYNTLLADGDPFRTSDLYIVDQTHAYVTNQKGATLLSTNGGANWTTVAGTVGSAVTSLSFTDSQHGWAIGDGLWRTTNGGSLWQAVNPIILGS